MTKGNHFLQIMILVLLQEFLMKGKIIENQFLHEKLFEIIWHFCLASGKQLTSSSEWVIFRKLTLMFEDWLAGEVHKSLIKSGIEEFNKEWLIKRLYENAGETYQLYTGGLLV